MIIINDTLKHIREYPSTAEDSGTATRTACHFLQRVINNLSGKIQLSATQAPVHLLNMPSALSLSYFFIVFFWPAVSAVCLREKKYDSDKEIDLIESHKTDEGDDSCNGSEKNLEQDSSYEEIEREFYKASNKKNVPDMETTFTSKSRISSRRIPLRERTNLHSQRCTNFRKLRSTRRNSRFSRLTPQIFEPGWIRGNSFSCKKSAESVSEDPMHQIVDEQNRPAISTLAIISILRTHNGSSLYTPRRY